jgi:hypothetical protein
VFEFADNLGIHHTERNHCDALYLPIPGGFPTKQATLLEFHMNKCKTFVCVLIQYSEACESVRTVQLESMFSLSLFPTLRWQQITCRRALQEISLLLSHDIYSIIDF